MPIAQKRILITPLNWGLGHATRCIPIIHQFRSLGARVYIASDGDPLHLLKKEFPDLDHLELPPYRVHYKGKHLTWSMLRQSAKIIAALAKEQLAIEEIIKTAEIDAIISDNRFGCFSKKIPSVFMTHQFNLITPSKLLDKPANLTNHLLIKNFDEVWVPDFKGEINLAGKLSHPVQFKKVKYLGSLSRMKKREIEKKYQVVAVLSGPEPKRTELEKILLGQLKKLEFKTLLVRGLPKAPPLPDIAPHITTIPYLSSAKLNEVMLSAEVIIARSGYSTIMDLLELEQAALLIPTPGQTEQEYLAMRLQEEGIFTAQQQNMLDLKSGLANAIQQKGFHRKDYPEVDLKKELELWLESI